jgi:hypothetical protein
MITTSCATARCMRRGRRSYVRQDGPCPFRRRVAGRIRISCTTRFLKTGFITDYGAADCARLSDAPMNHAPSIIRPLVICLKYRIDRFCVKRVGAMASFGEGICHEMGRPRKSHERRRNIGTYHSCRNGSGSTTGPSQTPSTPLIRQQQVPPPPTGPAIPLTPDGAPASDAPPVPASGPAPAAPLVALPDYRAPVDWTKVPPVTPLPRPGSFIIPPNHPGYHDILVGFSFLLPGSYLESAAPTVKIDPKPYYVWWSYKW